MMNLKPKTFYCLWHGIIIVAGVILLSTLPAGGQSDTQRAAIYEKAVDRAIGQIDAGQCADARHTLREAQRLAQ